MKNKTHKDEQGNDYTTIDFALIRKGEFYLDVSNPPLVRQAEQNANSQVQCTWLFGSAEVGFGRCCVTAESAE